MFLLLTSCSEMFKEKGLERTDIINIYNELKKDSTYTKFIGYHIVRRDNENYFMHRNLMVDSSDFIVPNWKASEGTKGYKEKELFLKNNHDAKLQFDIMNELGIRAVLTYNYNPETKRLESDENIGYEFDKYELTFMLSDSIEISTINFSFDDYMKIKSKYYEVTEKLDSNWFVLKRK